MDKKFLFDDVLKEKASNEKLIVPDDLNSKINETMACLPERSKSKKGIALMYNKMWQVGSMIKSTGFIEAAVFILLLIAIPVISHNYLGKKPVVGDRRPVIENEAKPFSLPNSIIIYGIENSFELSKDDVNYLKIVELLNERIDNKISTVKDIIDDEEISKIKKDGLGIELIYKDEQELAVKGDGFKAFRYNRLYFQLTSEKYGDFQYSIIDNLQYGDKEHYKDSSRGPLKYSEELIKLVRRIVVNHPVDNGEPYNPFKDIKLNTSSTDIKVIGKEIFELFLKSYTDKKVYDSERISEYKIDDIKFEKGNLEEFMFYVIYSEKPATDRYIIAGNGNIEKDGWITHRSLFVNVKKINGVYMIVNAGTGP